MKAKKYRRAVFVVVYSKTKKKIKYLILKRKLHWKGWEFPKGGCRIYETLQMAVRREVKEETGLKILRMKKFKESGRYKYKKECLDRPKVAGQTYNLYAVEVKKKKIILDDLEHSDFKWVEYKNALKKLTWANQKKCLKIVNKSLNK